MEDDDWGFGGSKGTCDFYCPNPSVIAVSITADDPDAEVEVTGECPDESETCESPPKQHCDTVGTDSNDKEGNGTCTGETWEFWDSGFVMACAAVGANADLCDLVPQLPQCAVAGDENPNPHRAACLATNPSLLSLGDERLGLLFPYWEGRAVEYSRTALFTDGAAVVMDFRLHRDDEGAPFDISCTAWLLTCPDTDAAMRPCFVQATLSPP